jgi:flavin reductase
MNAIDTSAELPPRLDLAQRVSLFKVGMRRLASGIALITSGTEEDQYAGLVATAVNSLSMDPPTLLVCVNKSGSAHAVIEACGAICVNLLSEDDHALVDIFGSSSRRHERFKVGKFEATPSGPPRLTTALVTLECKVVQTYSYQTHTLFLGEVMDVQFAESEDAKPLVYMDRTFHQLRPWVARAAS